MAKKVTGFELSPQGQIGSGFAQVFDTSNLVAAQVNLRAQREAEFNRLISTLSEIDPSKVHPKDTEMIVSGVNDLYDFVVNNYDAIANPRKDPSKLLEFNRRKSTLLGAAFDSQQGIAKAAELAKEIPKNEYYMGAYNQNAQLLERLNSETVLTRNEDGTLVRNPNFQKVYSEKLKIGKSANEFATQVANDTKAQFDVNNPNVQTLNFANGQVIMISPNNVSDAEADRIIDASLMEGADAVAVVNSILGVEVPYNILDESQKQVVRDSIRPLFLQRLDTKPIVERLGRPSSPSGDKKQLDVEQRIRTIDGIMAVGEEVGLLSDAKWGQSSAVVRGVTSEINANGELVYTVNLIDGNKQTKREYVMGQQNPDGTISFGETDAHRKGAMGFIAAANTTLNATQGGDLRTPDMEDLNADLFNRLKQRIEGGEFEINLGRGDTFQVGKQRLTRDEAKGELISALDQKGTAIERFGAFKQWAVDNGVSINELEPTISPQGKVTIKLGDTKVMYDLSTEEGKSKFADVLLDRVVLESGVATTERVRVGGAKPQGVGSKYNK